MPKIVQRTFVPFAHLLFTLGKLPLSASSRVKRLDNGFYVSVYIAT